MTRTGVGVAGIDEQIAGGGGRQMAASQDHGRGAEGIAGKDRRALGTRGQFHETEVLTVLVANAGGHRRQSHPRYAFKGNRLVAHHRHPPGPWTSMLNCVREPRATSTRREGAGANAGCGWLKSPCRGSV